MHHTHTSAGAWLERTQLTDVQPTHTKQKFWSEHIENALAAGIQANMSYRDQTRLQSIKGMPRGMVRLAGQDLVSRMRDVESLPSKELEGYPRPVRTGPGRPTPEEEERAQALKEARNARAEELGLARGALISNATLLELARRWPTTEAGLREVPGVKEWHLEAVGDALLAALKPAS